MPAPLPFPGVGGLTLHDELVSLPPSLRSEEDKTLENHGRDRCIEGWCRYGGPVGALSEARAATGGVVMVLVVVETPLPGAVYRCRIWTQEQKQK